MSEEIKAVDVQTNDKLTDTLSSYNIPKRSKNSPKTRKETWIKVRLDFEANNYTSLTELAHKHNVSYQSLRDRIWRESWTLHKKSVQDVVLRKIDQTVLKVADRTSEYLLRLSKRAEKYEKIIDASLDQAGAKDAQGVNVIDLDAIDVVTRSEQRVMEMQKTALRIAPLSQLDITTNGQSLGASFISAISKLREDASAPKLTDSDLSKVLEAEIIEDKPKQ